MKSGELVLPDEYPYLGRQSQLYRVVKRTAQAITIKRSAGQEVEIPIDMIFRCYDALMKAPKQTLLLQEIIPDLSDSIQVGESVMAATLVAAGLAKVVNRKPKIILQGV